MRSKEILKSLLILLIPVLISACQNSNTEDRSLPMTQEPLKTNPYKPEDNLGWIGEKPRTQKDDFDWKGDLRPGGNTSILNFRSSSEFRHFFDSTTLKNPFQAPPAVGLLLIYDEEVKGVSRCTAFLVEKDILATNSHCVPKDFKARGSNLQDRIYFLGSQGHIARVSMTTQASDISDNKKFSADFAFLKLEAPVLGVTPFKISRAGFPDQAHFTIWKVDPEDLYSPATDKPNAFQINRVDCQPLFGKIVFPASQVGANPIISMSGCDIRHGNSGSPVVASDGTVRGVAFGFLSLSNMIFGKTMTATEMRATPQVSLVTNYTCVKDYSPQQSPLPQECSVDLDQNAPSRAFLLKNQELLKKHPTDLVLQMRNLAEKWITENSKIFKFKVKEADLPLNNKFPDAVMKIVEVEFDCIKPYEQWKNTLQKEVKLSFSKEITFSIETIFLSLTPSVDRNFELRPGIKTEKSVYQISIGKDQLRKKEINLALSYEIGKVKIPSSRTLSVCQ